MKIKFILLSAIAFTIAIKSNAQFCGIVGTTNCSAMYKDSSAFVAWANQCKIIRGYQQINNQSGGFATVGDSSLVLGMAGSNGVVSLGDGGLAIVQFTNAIYNGVGNDFAVFENGFDDLFLELAFVEASSDGINYFRFPATSNSDTVNQINGFGQVDATKINNLAGKYRAQYGTPFNIDDLPNAPLLNKNAITHIKLIDVIGCVQNQFCMRDANNHIVNDPWPTPFASSGFDLDAVGVIYNLSNVGITSNELFKVSVFPNPTTNVLHVASLNFNSKIVITNMYGQIISEHLNTSSNLTIDTEFFTKGVYVLTITTNKKTHTLKFIKQ